MNNQKTVHRKRTDNTMAKQKDQAKRKNNLQNIIQKTKD